MPTHAAGGGDRVDAVEPQSQAQSLPAFPGEDALKHIADKWVQVAETRLGGMKLLAKEFLFWEKYLFLPKCAKEEIAVFRLLRESQILSHQKFFLMFPANCREYLNNLTHLTC